MSESGKAKDYTTAIVMDKTELRFTHVGLAPAIECYSDCSDTWRFYLRDSLRKLTTTGKGAPNRPSDPSRTIGAAFREIHGSNSGFP